jgi:hypothetical protein
MRGSRPRMTGQGEMRHRLFSVPVWDTPMTSAVALASTGGTES